MSMESLEKIIEERAVKEAERELDAGYLDFKKLLRLFGVAYSNVVWKDGERALKYCFKDNAPSHLSLEDALSCIHSAAIEIRARQLLPRLRQAVIDNALKESKK